MISELLEKSVESIGRSVYNKYPALSKNILNNCITYKQFPVLPWFLTPRVTPYLFKKNQLSIGECIEVYRKTESIHQLKKHKSSETLAILGSGSSIQNLTEEDYSMISSVDSLALNWWGVYHDFTPDFYKFELGSEFKEHWIENINSKSSDYEDTVFIYEPERMFFEGENTAETILQLDPEIRKNMVDLRIIEYFRSDDKEFRDPIIKKLFPTTLQNRVLHSRGSLSQAIAISYLLGYEHTILFGVDLNHSGYFFSNHPNSHKSTDQGKDEKENHATAESTGTKTIDEYVKYVNANFFEKENRRMYISSKESLLYPMLDYYKQHPRW